MDEQVDIETDRIKAYTLLNEMINPTHEPKERNASRIYSQVQKYYEECCAALRQSKENKDVPCGNESYDLTEADQELTNRVQCMLSDDRTRRRIPLKWKHRL